MTNISHSLGGWMGRIVQLWSRPTTGRLCLIETFLDCGLGCCMEVMVPRALEKYAIVVFRALQRDGEDLLATPEFAGNDEGVFLRQARIINRKCAVYIPFSALQYSVNGVYWASATTIRAKPGTEPIVRDFSFFPLHLPEPKYQSKIDYLQPWIDLCMRVVRSDGEFSAIKLRCMMERFVEKYELTSTQIVQLRAAIERASDASLEALTGMIWFRFPEMGHYEALGTLTDIAKSDGAVSAAEVSIIRSVALAQGMTVEYWESAARYVGLVDGDGKTP